MRRIDARGKRYTVLIPQNERERCLLANRHVSGHSMGENEHPCDEDRPLLRSAPATMRRRRRRRRAHATKKRSRERETCRITNQRGRGGRI
nr:MAG: hypothetical protein DIU78_25450 [Pseudomonadota bacterium]